MFQHLNDDVVLHIALEDGYGEQEHARQKCGVVNSTGVKMMMVHEQFLSISFPLLHQGCILHAHLHLILKTACTVFPMLGDGWIVRRGYSKQERATEELTGQGSGQGGRGLQGQFISCRGRPVQHRTLSSWSFLKAKPGVVV